MNAKAVLARFAIALFSLATLAGIAYCFWKASRSHADIETSTWVLAGATIALVLATAALGYSTLLQANRVLAWEHQRQQRTGIIDLLKAHYNSVAWAKEARQTHARSPRDFDTILQLGGFSLDEFMLLFPGFFKS